MCATRGEAGETRIPTDDLAGLREVELRAAAEVLGVGSVQVLGYVDSGMDGAPAAGTLAACDPGQLADELRSLREDVGPDVVVTLDPTDGHRDHAVIRDATLAAIDGSDRSPPATHLWCLARSSMARWAERMRATGGGDAYLAIGELGTPDDEITLLVDVAEHLPKRWAAIHAHASQGSPYDDLDPDLQREFLGVDRLRLTRGEDLLRR